MNWVDLVVLGVILVSGLLAFARGLIRELLGIGAWVAAAIVASSADGLIQPWMRRQIADTALADTLAFVSVFVVALILLSIIAGVMAAAFRRTGLGGVDRTLGLLFGLARGALVVCLAYILAGLAVAVDQWPAPVLEARSLPIVYDGAAWVAAHVPGAYRPAVAVPPGRRTSAAELDPFDKDRRGTGLPLSGALSGRRAENASPDSALIPPNPAGGRPARRAE